MLPGEFSQHRHPYTDELVAVAVVSRAGLEKPLRVLGDVGVGQLVELAGDGGKGHRKTLSEVVNSEFDRLL